MYCAGCGGGNRRCLRFDNDLERPRFVEEAEIPTSAAVHELAPAATERSGVWWRELEVQLVAYSGLRWGEHAA
jgi:hypothetical protein